MFHSGQGGGSHVNAYVAGDTTIVNSTFVGGGTGIAYNSAYPGTDLTATNSAFVDQYQGLYSQSGQDFSGVTWSAFWNNGEDCDGCENEQCRRWAAANNEEDDE